MKSRIWFFLKTEWVSKGQLRLPPRCTDVVVRARTQILRVQRSTVTNQEDPSLDSSLTSSLNKTKHCNFQNWTLQVFPFKCFRGDIDHVLIICRLWSIFIFAESCMRTNINHNYITYKKCNSNMNPISLWYESYQNLESGMDLAKLTWS